MTSTLTKAMSHPAVRLCWLDLRASGLSMIERLSLEEALLRHDHRNWAIVGNHEPHRHKYLRDVPLPDYMQSLNPDCMIVMGIGGKADQLLNIPRVRQDQVLVVKRFSGGGTVVLDGNSIWTTLIGRTEDFTNVKPYPEAIMEWSADTIFGPAFDHLSQENQHQRGQKTLAMSTKSCSATENLGQVIRLNDDKKDFPKFSLRENDYVFGDHKMGGNAQSIVKGGWLHHTSFLWDYDPDNMEYLTLPSKRPDYRGDRSHEDFLVRLAPYFGKGAFVQSMFQACQSSMQVEKVALPEAMKVVDDKLGGMEQWFGKNRIRIQMEL